jgi:UPF0042 nucleotide-binding protein
MNDILASSEQKKRQIVFVSGLSGAGMSSVLKNLEDFGFEVFDNMPLFLVDSLLKSQEPDIDPQKPLAFGLDSRTRGFSPPDILAKIEYLKKQHEYDVSLCFISCADDIIHQRYSHTRRPHPIAREQTVAQGIAIEKEWLKPLKDAADLSIDTTDMSVHDLKRLLGSRYFHPDAGNKVYITLMSFGFKNGTPREADMILDVRFLQNPHWEAQLRPLTGRDEEVQNFIRKDDAFDAFIQKVKDMLTLILPRYEVEGKSYFTLALGCTGGRHRSVFLAEHLADFIKELEFSVNIRHRDLQ